MCWMFSKMLHSTNRKFSRRGARSANQLLTFLKIEFLHAQKIAKNISRSLAQEREEFIKILIFVCHRNRVFLPQRFKAFCVTKILLQLISLGVSFKANCFLRCIKLDTQFGCNLLLRKVSDSGWAEQNCNLQLIWSDSKEFRKQEPNERICVVQLLYLFATVTRASHDSPRIFVYFVFAPARQERYVNVRFMSILTSQTKKIWELFSTCLGCITV